MGGKGHVEDTCRAHASPGDVQSKAIVHVCSLSSSSVLMCNEVLDELGCALPSLPQTAQKLGRTKAFWSRELRYGP